MQDKDIDKVNQAAVDPNIVNAVGLSTTNKPYSTAQSDEIQFRSRLITSELNMRYERFDLVHGEPAQPVSISQVQTIPQKSYTEPQGNKPERKDNIQRDNLIVQPLNAGKPTSSTTKPAAPKTPPKKTSTPKVATAKTPKTNTPKTTTPHSTSPKVIVNNPDTKQKQRQEYSFQPISSQDSSLNDSMQSSGPDSIKQEMMELQGSPRSQRRKYQPHPLVEEFKELSQYDEEQKKRDQGDASLEEVIDGLLGMPKVEDKMVNKQLDPKETPKMKAFRLLREAETPNASRAQSMVSLNSINSVNSNTLGMSNGPSLNQSTFSLNKEERDKLGDEVVMVKCRNPKCGKTSELVEAQFSYKTCHHCYTYYCSRECRKAHWERHEKKCILSKVNSQTKHIIKKIHDDPVILAEMTRVSRTGYLQKGRGCVMVVFSSPATADIFLERCMDGLEVPATFTTIRELEESDLLGDHLPEVVEMCKSYNPDVKFVFEVAIIPGEIPEGSVPPRRDRQVMYKCAKLRLSNPESIRPTEGAQKPENDTLILTAVPSQDQRDEIPGDTPAKKARELCFVNIQKKLRQRGVSLRHMFPDVYSKLCQFVADGKHFTPITIFPTDGKTREEIRVFDYA